MHDSHVLLDLLQLYIHTLYEHIELCWTCIENRSILLRPNRITLERLGMHNKGTPSNLSYTTCGMVPLLVGRSGAFVCTIAPHLCFRAIRYSCRCVVPRFVGRSGAFVYTIAPYLHFLQSVIRADLNSSNLGIPD